MISSSFELIFRADRDGTMRILTTQALSLHSVAAIYKESYSSLAVTNGAEQTAIHHWVAYILRLVSE